MSQPVVIFTNGGGRLSNQLLNCAHLFAWVSEYNYGLLNMAFWPYANNYCVFEIAPLVCVNEVPVKIFRLFQKLHQLTQSKSANNQRRLNKVFKFYLKFLNSINGSWTAFRTKDYTDLNAPLDKLDLADPEFNRHIKSKQVTLLSGWNIRNWELLEKNADKVRELLAPSKSILDPGDELIAKLRSNCDLLVGLFIRQGDYKTWKGGKYYFSLNQYNNWCQQIISAHPGKRITFLISGEQIIDKSEFSSNLDIQFSNGSANCGGTPYNSHYEFSKCDLIASAPSTFSAWAAFMGNVPLIPLFEEQINLDQMINSLTQASLHPHFKYAVN